MEQNKLDGNSTTDCLTFGSIADKEAAIDEGDETLHLTVRSLGEVQRRIKLYETLLHRMLQKALGVKGSIVMIKLIKYFVNI